MPDSFRSMVLFSMVRMPIFEEKCQMSDEKKNRVVSTCLHCGNKIRYGRRDKKFCCSDCKDMHYNSLQKGSRAFRRRILAQLEHNYEVLTEIWRSEAESVDLADAQMHGFIPGLFTSCSRKGPHHEYCCFDIRYIMTATRIYSVSKIQNVSLNLRKL